MKDLERDNQKAELNVQSGQYDYKNSINKSNEAQQKQDMTPKQRFPVWNSR
ncbi:MAG: hypothetical protein ACLU2Y_14625 [Blautia massiliensis (ex Durand et al. 2017)]|uniref:hypothetical protein n=1 Tax=Blautia massiliensis (ex Durand et al. 2017) TaxID=1737424 RepID=UPI00399D461D